MLEIKRFRNLLPAPSQQELGAANPNPFPVAGTRFVEIKEVSTVETCTVGPGPLKLP